MDFLRRLAPRPEGDTTHAVPALPSRFASESPLRAAAVAAVWKPMNEDDALARIPGLPSPPAAMQASADSAGAHRALQPEVASPRAIKHTVTDPHAALPSRFASESPLRATIGPARLAQRPDDDQASLSLDATSASAATNVLAAQRHPVTGVQPSQAAPRPLGSGPTRRHYGKATSSTHVPAEVPDIDVVDPRVFQDRNGANSARARPTSPKLQGLAVALAGSHGLQDGAPQPARPRVALPLSQSILTQRTLQSRDDSQVVHVTIGRIDVVANTAPAPAVRRSPTPRQGTVTLADYLRRGSRR